MTEPAALMPIGRFSSMARLSVRMLRHYDTHGVLVPAAVDEATGYRRYAPGQLVDAAAIRDLRDVGFGVSAISAMLAARGTEAWHQALDLQREAIASELRAVRAKAALIDRMIDQKETTMPITVTRTTVPAMTVATLRGTVRTYAHEGELWDRMMPALAAAGVVPSGPCGVIEHDDQYLERDVDLSVFMPVEPGTSVDAPLEVIELPERDCLVARVVGPYAQISAAHDLINARIAEGGLAVRADGTPASHAFNRYLATPDEVPEAELVTEVFEPLA